MSRRLAKKFESWETADDGVVGSSPITRSSKDCFDRKSLLNVAGSVVQLNRWIPSFLFEGEGWTNCAFVVFWRGGLPIVMFGVWLHKGRKFFPCGGLGFQGGFAGMKLVMYRGGNRVFPGCKLGSN
jgi:hypothetical protein